MRGAVTTYLSVALLLSVGLHQSLSRPTSAEDDPTYILFKSIVELNRELAETKLNYTREALRNYTKTFDIPSEAMINSTLIGCLEDAKTAYPNTDPDCVIEVTGDVKETIYDSQQELAFCTNLTNSWGQIEALFTAAEESIKDLEGVVSTILAGAQVCVSRYPSNPNRKFACMQNTQQSYDESWKNATSLVQQTYYGLSGVSLLLDAEAQNCEKAEINTLRSKCETITADVLTCLLPTTTITPTTLVPTSTIAPTTPVPTSTIAPSTPSPITTTATAPKL